MAGETELKQMVARVIDVGNLLAEAAKHAPVTQKQSKPIEPKPQAEISKETSIPHFHK